MMPRAPAVMFKRPLRYLPQVGPIYAKVASLHVIDETPLHSRLLAAKNSGLTADSFCAAKCACPGQVRWHAGHKTHRLRGLQMALVYAGMLGKAAAKYKELLRAAGGAPLTAAQAPAVPGLGACRRRCCRGPSTARCAPPTLPSRPSSAVSPGAPESGE